MKNISAIFSNPTTTPELEKTFETIKTELGAPFVPHFFQIWGDSPMALQGIVPAMKYILGNGDLDRKLKEMIMIAVSSFKNCDYCQAAHHVFCSSMGAIPEQIENLTTSYTLSDHDNPKDKAAIDFAVKLAKDPKSSNEEDYIALKELGYSKSEVLEIIAMSGMAVFYSHLADATQITIDKAFSDALSKTVTTSE